MTSALALIPQGASLVEREPQVAEWIDAQDDMEALRQARALLAAWRSHAERGAVERDAAVRLDIRAERRIGALLGPPMPREERGALTERQSSPVEQQAASRARALAAVPVATFEAVIAEPKPSRAKLLAAAIVPEPTVDPSAEESARVHRIVRGPATDSWPRAFDTAMLNDKAVATIRESVESWRSWCDQWDAALDAAPRLRRIR